MMLLANQAIQTGQQNLLSVANKKEDESSNQTGLVSGPHKTLKSGQSVGNKATRSDLDGNRTSSNQVSGKTSNSQVAGKTTTRPDLDGWCPAWATHRNQKQQHLKVQNENYATESAANSKYYNQAPKGLAHQTARLFSGQETISAAAHLAALKADLLATPVAVPVRQSVPVAAASAPSFFSMGPEEEVFDIELEELTNQVKKTVLLTPKQRTPGAQTRPSSEKISKAPVRRNSRTVIQRKRSFQCEEVMEYAVDTYIWKLHLQAKYHVDTRMPDYQSCGITGEMRQTLLQWLANVARHLTFSLETWCLAVNYLDRFVAVQAVDKECLQLVGLTTLLIAAKIEEQNPPEILELVELCSSAYTRKNFKHMEVIILSRLDYKLLAPTASFLLSHKVQVMGAKADWPNDLSRHMVEMILSDPDLGFFIPADIATAIYTVIKRSDSMMLREITIHCPICAPVYGDIYAREFVVCCYNEISDTLLKIREQV